MKYVLIIFYILFTLMPFSLAEEGHDHKHEEEKSNTADKTTKKSESKATKKSDEHEHSEDEKHSKEEHEHSENEGETHAKEEGHEEHGDHDDHGDEHGEENSQVGPDKGILEASEENGIKLSPEAEKNFDVEKTAVNSSQPITISKKTIVTSGVEVNVYRYRDGFYKRIDFVQISKNENTITISSKDLVRGDSIVTKGLGFILIAEIAAFGGAPEGHSH
ncbi:hypothetical protein K2P97_00520 [bacterium]|nr:hypothetical protein [bacterium]